MESLYNVSDVVTQVGQRKFPCLIIENPKQVRKLLQRNSVDRPKIGCLVLGELKMSTRWLLTFQAIDPRNPKRHWNVGIIEKLYKRLQANGHEKAIARLHLVAEVLQGGTTYLYEGWSRPGKEEECFVYVGSPTRDFKSLRIETPAPVGMLFLVFVLSDGTIDEWTWRERSENEGEESVPAGINGRLIWSLNPS